jgi:hypothetical protein
MDMANINSSSFGSITVDNVNYSHDIYILPSGKVEKREYGHTFSKEQVEHLLKENPEIIVIGKGTSGYASLSREAGSSLFRVGNGMNGVYPTLEVLSLYEY